MAGRPLDGSFSWAGLGVRGGGRGWGAGSGLQSRGRGRSGCRLGRRCVL